MNLTKASIILGNPTVQSSLVVLIISSLWWMMIPNPLVYQDSRLKMLALDVQNFIEVESTTPESLLELQAFSLPKKGLQMLDQNGRDYVFQPLSRTLFFLQRPRDHSGYLMSTISNLAPIPDHAPRVAYQSQPKPHLYPSPLLIGTRAPSGDWYAEVVQDKVRGLSRLVVRSTFAEETVIVPHEGIEEFVWLADSSHIVFTARDSGRYQQGLFYYSLRTREAKSLPITLTKEHLVDIKDAGPERFYHSIAGVHLSDNVALVFVMPLDHAELSPRSFYHHTNLFEVKVDGENVAVNPSKGHSVSVLDMPDHRSGIISDRLEIPVLRRWSQLSLSGPAQTVIDGWQEFISEHKDSPMLPYGLWILSSIYNEACKRAGSQDLRRTLRSFALEISKALSTDVSAPNYLRAFGGHQYQVLSQGKYLDYRLANLTRIE